MMGTVAQTPAPSLISVLQRKWRTFSADPRYVIECKYETPVRWRLRRHLRGWSDAIGRKRLGEEAVAVIENFNSRRPADSLPPDWYDLSLLYNDVLEMQPDVVLEYGSGVSTAVLALAVHRNGKGKVISLESEAFWAKTNEAALQDYLRTVCSVIHSPVYPETIHGVKGWRFGVECWAQYIYVDGPPGVDDRVVTIDPAFHTEATRIVVDGKTQTKHFISKMLNRKARYRSLFSNDSVIDVHR